MLFSSLLTLIVFLIEASEKTSGALVDSEIRGSSEIDSVPMPEFDELVVISLLLSV